MLQALMAPVREQLGAYLAAFPQDAEVLRPLMDQLDRGEDVFDRRNFNGHITGAGIVLSPDHERVLLIYHNRFDRWQQPGGHAEAQDRTLLDTAVRETAEETGVRLRRALPVCGRIMPVHIGIYMVPANPDKDEGRHRHYDFRYVFEAATGGVRPQEQEVSAAEWFALDTPETAHVAAALWRLPDVIPAASC